MTALADFELRSTTGLFNGWYKRPKWIFFKPTYPGEVDTWQNGPPQRVQSLLGDVHAANGSAQPT